MSTRRKVSESLVEALAMRLPLELLSELKAIKVCQLEFTRALAPRELDVVWVEQDCAVGLRLTPQFMKRAWTFLAQLREKAQRAQPFQCWGALPWMSPAVLERWERICFRDPVLTAFSNDNLSPDEPVWTQTLGGRKVTLSQVIALDDLITRDDWSSEELAYYVAATIIEQPFDAAALRELSRRPATELAAIAAGLERVSKRRLKMRTLTVETLLAIGRASKRSYRALLADTGIQEAQGAGTVVHPHNLNWRSYEEAEKSPAKRFKLLNHLEQWIALFPCVPYNATRCPLVGLRTATCNELFEEFDLWREKSARVQDRALAQAIVQLVVLFGDRASIMRHVRASGHAWTSKGVHDSAQFTLPESINAWTPLKWRALCLRHPQALQYSGFFAELEAAGPVPNSLSRLREAVRRLVYPDPAPGYENFVELCLNAGVAAEATRQCVEYLQARTPKPAEFLPQVVVHASEVGSRAGLALLKLDADDKRGIVLGVLTRCCQHLQGVGAESAKAGMESPFSGFYGIFDHGMLVAQCWAWRASNGAIVFDSWESATNVEQPRLDVYAAMIGLAAKKLVAGPLGICAVLLGDTDSGFTKKLAEALRLKSEYHKLLPVEDRGYFDAKAPRPIAGHVAPGDPCLTVAVEAVEGYRISPELDESGDPTLAWANLSPRVISWPTL